MTVYKLYRVNSAGTVTIEIQEAHDWVNLLSMFQYDGDPIFRIDVVGGTEPEDFPHAA